MVIEGLLVVHCPSSRIGQLVFVGRGTLLLSPEQHADYQSRIVQRRA
jgi:hypothetical protein